MPEVRRTPIVISEHSIALVTLFKMETDHLDDLWMMDWIREEIRARHRRSAKQMIDALEDTWSPAFLLALSAP